MIMNLSVLRRYKLQNGVTMLSLMVGLFVSTLSVLASLSMYQNLRVVANDTKSGAVHDGQIASTMLVAEKFLMNAGYGITDAGTADVVVVREATTSTSAASISLLWRYVNEASVVCAGFRETETLIAGRKHRTLKVIESVADCTLGADLATLSWTDEIAILGQWPINDDVASYLSENETLFDFQISQAICSPFGYGDPNNHLNVRMSVPGTVELINALAAGGYESQFCLANTYPI